MVVPRTFSGIAAPMLSIKISAVNNGSDELLFIAPFVLSDWLLCQPACLCRGTRSQGQRRSEGGAVPWSAAQPLDRVTEWEVAGWTKNLL